MLSNRLKIQCFILCFGKKPFNQVSDVLTGNMARYEKNKENLSTYEYIINDNKLVFTYGLRDDNFIEYMVYYDEKYNYLYSDYVTRFFIGSYPSYYGLLGDYVVSINDMDYYTITDGGSVNFTDNNVHIALIKYLNEEK